MKSSTGNYYIGLDHIRAFAALLVFCWHFLHGAKGSPIPFDYVAVIPFSLFNEGHTGVSIFMVLSGYLFAKILNNQQVNYFYFFCNRFFRLAPLMIFVVLINCVIRYFKNEPSIWYFFASLVNGLVYPSLPNGGWSITVEFHFYLLLPILLLILKRSVLLIPFLIILSIIFRSLYFREIESIQYVSYWTIIGRIDLFLFGMLAFQWSPFLLKSKWIVWCSVLSVIILYWAFDHIGGYRGTKTNALWVYWHSIEGLFYSVILVFYDRWSQKLTGHISKFIANIGKCSYSMYLLHIFFVFDMARFAHSYLPIEQNFYLTLLCAILSFLVLVPVALISYYLVERPFLRMRFNYLT